MHIFYQNASFELKICHFLPKIRHFKQKTDHFDSDYDLHTVFKAQNRVIFGLKRVADLHFMQFLAQNGRFHTKLDLM